MIKKELERVHSYGIDFGSDEGWERLRDTFEWEDLNHILPADGERFYEARIEKVKDFVNTDVSFGNYSEAEKEYWLKKAEEIKTPFAWGSKEEMTVLWDTVLILAFGIFIVLFCVAPIFFPFSKSSNLRNHVNYLFPIRGVNLREGLRCRVQILF